MVFSPVFQCDIWGFINVKLKIAGYARRPCDWWWKTLSFRAERSVVEKSQLRMRSLHFGRDDRMQETTCVSFPA